MIMKVVKKKVENQSSIDTMKNETYEINNNNKYVSAFLFSTFKLIEKVRKIYFFNFLLYNIVKRSF